MVTIVEMVKSNGTDVYVCHRYLVEKAFMMQYWATNS